MFNISESEVTRDWIGQDVVVSICCAAYNHELYIEEAINSFLNQKTEYPFEIIVNDDASTDATKKILLEYKRKYPNIIRLILHEKNQFSLGKRPLPFIIERSNGRYLAICEGDDYWLDTNKLQYQVALMKKFPEVDISFHPSRIVKGTELQNLITGKRGSSNQVIPLSRVITGGGVFCPTQSIIVTKDVIDNLPELFFRAPIGDYFLQVLASIRGGALYINKVMSAYRVDIAVSWTSNIWSEGNNKNKFFTKMIASLNELRDHLPPDSRSYVQDYIDMMYYNRGISYLKQKNTERFRIEFMEYFKDRKKRKGRISLLYHVHNIIGVERFTRSFHSTFLSNIPTRLIRKIASNIGVDSKYT